MDRTGTASQVPDSAAAVASGAHDPLGLSGRRDFHLLVVDDSPGLRREVLDLVSRVDFVASCDEAANGLEGFKKAVGRRPDLILCDLIMPSVDGFKFLSLVQARPGLRDVPVILLTGQADVDTKIRGLGLGASDYVTKPFDGGELLARIKVQLKIKALQDALRLSNERLQELSSTDPLTGLFNRRYFMEALAGEFERVERYDTDLSFVMIDIDHFKRLNDTYGHQAGDDVLREMGQVIRDQIRTPDTPCRYGGEEFCVLLPQTPFDGAVEFARRLRLVVEGHPFPAQGGTVGLTASLGVSTAPSPRVGGYEDLIRLADEALYEAKESGRNRVCTREP